MATIRRITDLQLASINTTKVVNLTNTEYLFQISSGNRAFEACNLGNFNIFYGQSNLLATSGIFIASGGAAKFWDTITDNFQMAFVCQGTSQLIIQEYAGN